MEEEEGKGCIVLVWIMHHELTGVRKQPRRKGSGEGTGGLALLKGGFSENKAKK